MYCPHCGQQQSSEEMRFCSRCGFPLGVIAQVLAQGGVLATRDADSSQGRRMSPRQRGVRQGAMLMLSALLIVPLIVFAVILSDFDSLIPLVPLSAIVCVVGGFIRIAYALMFEDAGPRALHGASIPSTPLAQAQLNAPTRDQALPPAQSTPVTDWRRPQETAEIIQPPSVTENTTRLLESKDER
jgi:hypothetical protein